MVRKVIWKSEWIIPGITRHYGCFSYCSEQGEKFDVLRFFIAFRITIKNVVGYSILIR